MQNKQRYITAGVTIAAAAVTAHLMQQGSTPGDPNQPPPVTAAVAAPIPGLQAASQSRVLNEVTVVAAAPDDLGEAGSGRASDVPVETAAVDPAAALDALQVPLAGPPASPAEVVAALDPATLSDAPRPPEDVQMPAPLPNVGAELPARVARSSDGAMPPLTAEPERSQFGLPCGPILSASATIDGLVNLILSAPCRSDARFQVSHGLLAFTAETDALGTYQMTAPAMTAEAEFAVTFEDGATVRATATVDQLEVLDRVALVARAGSGFQIHAREFGAAYGEAGHVWAGNPGDPATAASEGGGYILSLGDPTLEDAMMSEVYTFPRDAGSESGVVRLSVEAEVTAANCATEVAGHTIEPGPSGMPVAMSMTVAVPDCDAIGEYLVLKNLLRDLKIASNN